MPTLRNVAIDPETGGYTFVGGQRQYVYDKDGIRQAIRCELQAFAGEWFLDDPNNPQVGIPYLQSILVKGADPRGVANIISNKIASIEGVVSVVSVNLAFNKKTRVLRIAYQVQTDAGLLTDTLTG